MIIKLAFVLCLISGPAPGQDPSVRTYARADFVNVEGGGGLAEKVERAAKQFKDAKGGDTLWIAYHFPARLGVSIGPFSGTVYRDGDGIRLERRDSPEGAAVFLLADVTGARPRVTSVKTLNLNEPYLFENRPVYWLGNFDAAQSLGQLEAVMRAEPENKALVRGVLRAVGAHDSPRVVPLLKEIAQKETNAELRRSAVANLGRVGTAESLDALDDLFKTTPEAALKQEIVRAYASAGERVSERRVLDRLTAIAKSEEPLEVRREALRRIAGFRGEAVADRLFEIYDRAPDRETRLEILRHVAVGDGPNDRVLRRLTEIAKRETDPDLQRAAVRRLSPSKGNEQLQALLEIYDGVSVEPVKEEVIGRLAQGEDRRALDKLVAIAKNDPSARLRQAAIRRLARRS